jgi:hypothetical protein
MYAPGTVHDAIYFGVSVKLASLSIYYLIEFLTLDFVDPVQALQLKPQKYQNI